MKQKLIQLDMMPKVILKMLMTAYICFENQMSIYSSSHINPDQTTEDWIQDSVSTLHTNLFTTQIITVRFWI